MENSNAKWFDKEVSENQSNILDINSLSENIMHAPEFYLVTIYRPEKVDRAIKNRWANIWTTNFEGHRMYTVFTSFDMALAEYDKKSKLHPESIMRVEKRTLQSLIKKWNFMIKLINVYGEFCYLCDGKKTFPDNYWEKWPEIYKEEAEKHEEKRIEKFISDKTYFKDKYNKRPVHYDCTISKIKLAWNDEIIDIFCDSNGPDNRYRPVVNGEYADEICNIYLKGEYFTKEDLDEYIKKAKNYKEEIK